MSYYLVHQKTGLTITDRSGRHSAYKTEAAAKACRTRVVEKMGYAWADLIVVRATHLQEFRESRGIPTQVERTNLMSGKKYMEDIDTPYFCSPSSEAYWSM